MTLAAAVMFLNEDKLLPRMLASLANQTRPPDLLLLVDDGSQDDSPVLASAFAERQLWARVLSRPRQRRTSDRLARASELIAFQWALGQLGADLAGYDVVAKLDADLELPPDFFARIMAAMEADDALGIAGAPLCVALPDGSGVAPEYSQPWHVRGATKFYRRVCWEQVSPLPAILGWDTIDETRARIDGWDVWSVPFPDHAPLHLRPTGSYDGAIRGYRRRGAAAWGYGAHPLNVIASGLVRMRQRPLLVGGIAYLSGWGGACLRRAPRAEPAVRRHLQREQLRRVRAAVSRGAGR
jgi:biofilm PGA synthesis N-glycosyltransferase PgaC